MADEERKIIIDEGWKQQVQREKEEAQRRQAAEAARTAAEEPEKEQAPSDAETDEAGLENLEELAEGEEGEEAYEASFTNLVASLATQAMLALGLIVPSGAQEIPINLDQARFAIDTLRVLQDKTKGNLTEDEEQQLKDTVNELQQFFVQRYRQYQEHALRQSGVDPANLRGSEQ